MDALLSYLAKGAVEHISVIALLMFLFVAGAKQWWVFGWLYEATTQERDRWQRLALQGTELAERAGAHPRRRA